MISDNFVFFSKNSFLLFSARVFDFGHLFFCYEKFKFDSLKQKKKRKEKKNTKNTIITQSLDFSPKMSKAKLFPGNKVIRYIWSDQIKCKQKRILNHAFHISPLSDMIAPVCIFSCLHLQKANILSSKNSSYLFLADAIDDACLLSLLSNPQASTWCSV